MAQSMERTPASLSAPSLHLHGAWTHGAWTHGGQALFTVYGAWTHGGQALFTVYRSWISYYDLNMTRPLRIEFPNAIYHVMARGNGRQAIFHIEDDYRTLPSTLKQRLSHFKRDETRHWHGISQHGWHIVAPPQRCES